MKQNIRRRFFQGLMLITALFIGIPTSVFAASNSVALTPASGTTQKGSEFTVSVDGYVTQSWWFWVPIGASSVQGSISFPKDRLKVVSIDSSGSAFPNGSVTPDNTTGKISFNNSSSGSHRNQNVHLFAIKFQAIDAGSANVAFDSAKYNIGTASTTGGTYTITSPPPPPSKPQPKPQPKPSSNPTPKPTPILKPTPKPTPTPSTTPTPEETPEPTMESDGGLKIENVNVTTNRQENKVAWSINNPEAETDFKYGTSKNDQKSEGVVAKQDDGSYVVSLTDLKPGTLYYFTIKAATSDNLQGGTYSGVLTTRGYPVQLTIEQNDLLLPGAKVKINERSFVANANAIITTELSDGTHKALITPVGSDETYEASFTVAKKTMPTTGNPDIQSFVLNVTAIGSSSNGDNSLILPLIGGAVGVITIASFAGFILFKRRQQKTEDASIDSDLLASTYGNAIDQYRNNTPEPNLEAVNTPNAVQQPIESTFAPQPPAEAMTTDSLHATTSNAPAADPSVVAPAFDPTSLPLPPAQEPSAAPLEPVEIPQEYSEIEQLSPELTQVESGQQIEPTATTAESSEPSAVYNEATGELDILHHHSEPTGNTTLDGANPSFSQADNATETSNSDSQADPSYLQVAPSSQTVDEQAIQLQTPAAPSQIVASSGPLPPQPPLSKPPLTAPQ